MSSDPNDPFAGNPNSPGQSATGAQANPHAKKSKGAKFWLIGCLGGSVLLGLVCCGGIAAMTQIGMSAMAGAFQSQIEGSPVIEEHIGEIESFTGGFFAMMEGAQSAEPGKPPELPFEVIGSKGTGTVYIQPAGGGQEPGIMSARLVMSDGQSYPIEIDAPVQEEVDLDGLFDAGEAVDPAAQP